MAKRKLQSAEIAKSAKKKSPWEIRHSIDTKKPIFDRLRHAHESALTVLAYLRSFFVETVGLRDGELLQKERFLTIFEGLVRSRSALIVAVENVEWHLAAATGSAVKYKSYLYPSWHSVVASAAYDIISKSYASVSFPESRNFWFAISDKKAKPEDFKEALNEKDLQSLRDALCSVVPESWSVYQGYQSRITVELATAVKLFCPKKSLDILNASDPITIKRPGRPPKSRQVKDEEENEVRKLWQSLKMSLDREPTHEEMISRFNRNKSDEKQRSKSWMRGVVNKIMVRKKRTWSKVCNYLLFILPICAFKNSLLIPYVSDNFQNLLRHKINHYFYCAIPRH